MILSSKEVEEILASLIYEQNPVIRKRMIQALITKNQSTNPDLIERLYDTCFYDLFGGWPLNPEIKPVEYILLDTFDDTVKSWREFVYKDGLGKIVKSWTSLVYAYNPAYSPKFAALKTIKEIWEERAKEITKRMNNSGLYALKLIFDGIPEDCKENGEIIWDRVLKHTSLAGSGLWTHKRLASYYNSFSLDNYNRKETDSRTGNNRYIITPAMIEVLENIIETPDGKGRFKDWKVEFELRYKSVD
jgi:hypothetical protein